jgi:hypothetical protein
VDIEDAQKTHIQLSSRDKCKCKCKCVSKKNDYSADTTQKTPAVDKKGIFVVFFGRKFTLHNTQQPLVPRDENHRHNWVTGCSGAVKATAWVWV